MTPTMARNAPTSPSLATFVALSDALPDSPTPTPVGSCGTSIDVRGEPFGPPVRQASELLAGVVARLDPGRLTGADAARLYELFAGIERLSTAGRMLLAPRIDESGVWRDTGHRTPAVMLAELEGVPTGQARNTLEVGQRLAQLPGTEEALRSGVLSGPKVTELSGAALLDPGNEQELLRGAGEQPLHQVRERCQRSRASSARNDPVAAVRRIHAARHFISWTDAEGAFCFQGRDTADRGARILQQMDFTASRLKRNEDSVQRGATGPEASPTTERNRRADAFFLLMTGRDTVGGLVGRTIDGSTDDGDPGPPAEQIAEQLHLATGTTSTATATDRSADAGSGVQPRSPDVIERPPNCSVMVRVDLDALLRGHALPGEVCEIDNQGPIPVAMARDLADDSFLRLVFHRAGDIRAVSHFGRTINRTLRTALAYRDRCCVVPGCGVFYGLEIDHIESFAAGGPTRLENLALLCHHHHFLKTYEGWTLSRVGTADDGSPTWAFDPLPPFGEEPDPPGG